MTSDFFFFLLVHDALAKAVHVKGDFRQVEQIGTFAVAPPCERCRARQPPRVPAHDFQNRDTLLVVDERVEHHLAGNAGNIACRTAKPWRMVSAF